MSQKKRDVPERVRLYQEKPELRRQCIYSLKTALTNKYGIIVYIHAILGMII